MTLPQKVVALSGEGHVDAATVGEAASRLEGCQRCNPAGSDLPLDWVLEEVTVRTGMVDFMMVEAAKCPTCRKEVSEKSLVERKDD